MKWFSKKNSNTENETIPDTSENKLAVKSLNDYHNVARYWQHLKKTYADGLELMDRLTLMQLETSIKHKFNAEGIEVLSCSFEKKNGDYFVTVQIKNKGKVIAYYG